MGRLGWLAVVGLVLLGAASDAGLTPAQQRALVERVDRLEQDVAQLKAACRAPAAGGLRTEDLGGGSYAGPAGSLAPHQLDQLRQDAEKMRKQVDDYNRALRQLEDSE